ncbi:MAG: alpha/beta hydrolase [Planctomycetaceae bacterium]|jgi:acetyl esterase|nr:alpha/beta hydrolase [Planctomycetaceae bacterium]
MTLLPESVRLLEELDALGLPPLSTISAEEARQRLVGPIGPVPPVAEVSNTEFPSRAGSLGARIYRPESETDQPLNLVVYYHGGGWVLGDLDSHDGSCRQLARSAHAVVVSVDYRLAPEARFPAAVDDCLDGLVWASGCREEWGVDGAVCVAGDSAGGNLAAVVAIRARDRDDVQVDCQVLVYPVTDCSLDTESYQQFSEGHGLTRESMRWFWEQYLGGHDGADPDASPLRAATLEGLAPAYVVTAEYDTLRDEGEAYADRLIASGVPVIRERVDGVLHGFMLHGDRFGEVAAVCKRIGQEIRRLGSE